MLYVTKGFFFIGNTKCLIIYVEDIPHTVYKFAPNKISLSLLTVYTLHTAYVDPADSAFLMWKKLYWEEAKSFKTAFRTKSTPEPQNTC
jgi:hypothetical protein